MAAVVMWTAVWLVYKSSIDNLKGAIFYNSSSTSVKVKSGFLNLIKLRDN